MTYSTAQRVAEFVPRIADQDNEFTTDTNPKLATVELWLNQVSSVMDSYLAQAGFSVPITEESVVLVIDLFVAQEVAALCEGVRGSGRFGPTNKAPHNGRFSSVFRDVQLFVKDNAVGFERMGALRNNSEHWGIAVRDTNEAGDPIFPHFQREAHENGLGILWNGG